MNAKVSRRPADGILRATVELAANLRPKGATVLIPMKVDYGVRTLVFLALRTTSRYVPASEIARSQHIPEPYLLRVCSELQKAGLIESRRGPSGGHKLARPADEITVADVVTSLDHSLAPTDCVEEPDECRLSGACSQREMWQDVEKMLVDHLTNVQVSDLAKKQSSLITALNPLVTAAPVAN